jgi:hypothetical protein
MNSVMDIIDELFTENPKIRNDSQPIRNPETQARKRFSQNSQDSQLRLENIQDNEPPRANGLGCVGCGNKIYKAVKGWEISELPVVSTFTHEHTSVTHWQCENCKVIYEIIGGTRGPQYIN